MILVSDIWSEIQRVLGTCDETETYSKINEAVEELSNMGIWSPLEVYMDICADGDEITLPDDIEVPMALNVGGIPADFRNRWFEFHLNGPGSDCCATGATYAWDDRGNFPTFRSPVRASKIAAYVETAEEETTIRVFGYDQDDKWIMTDDGYGNLKDGFDVPMIFGIGNGMLTDQKVKRITRVMKPVTRGFVRLVAWDPDKHDDYVLLGYYKPSDTEPEFRRIRISGGGCDRLCRADAATCCRSTTNWVRMRARRKVFKVSQQTDQIALHSISAIKLMCMAIRKYENDLADDADKYMGMAKAALMREQKTRNGPNLPRIQFDRGTYAGGRWDNMI